MYNPINFIYPKHVLLMYRKNHRMDAPVSVSLLKMISQDHIHSNPFNYVSNSIDHPNELTTISIEESIPGVWCAKCGSSSCEHQPSHVDGSLQYSPSQLNDMTFEKYSDCKMFKVTVAAATYNCVSLNDSVAYKKRHGKLYREKNHRSVQMENALWQKQFSVYAFQETRNPQGRHMSENFIKVSSGHENHNYGVDFWFSRIHPISILFPNGCTSTFVPTLDNIKHVFSCPRSLCISISIDGIELYFINVHSPDNKHGFSVIEAFWSKILQQIKYFRIPISCIVLLGDFNQKFGSRCTRAIGNHAPQQENKSGRYIHKCLLSLRLSLPSTFQQCRDGTQEFTYIHHNGTKNRIDYIAIPTKSMSLDTVNTSHLSIDYGESLHDHFMGTALFSIGIRCKMFFSKTIQYDPKKFENEELAAAFRDDCSKMSPLQKFADTSSANAYFNAFTYHALCLNFPVSSPTPVKPYISTYTCDQISYRKHLRDQYVKNKDVYRISMMRTIFNSWLGIAMYTATIFDDGNFPYKRDWEKCSMLQTTFNSWKETTMCKYWIGNLLPGRNIYTISYPLLVASAIFKRQVRFVQSCIVWDKHVYVQELCYNANRCLDNGDARGFYSTKKKLVARSTKKSDVVSNSFVYDIYGNAASSPSQIKLAHKQNFIEKLGGIDIDFNTIVEEHRNGGSPSSENDFSVTHEFLQHLVKRSKPDKAPGNDQLTYEVFKKFPELLEQIAWLSNKCIAGKVPLQWCGALTGDL